MIELNWTLGALIINFLLLVFLLNLVLFRPIRKVLKERQAKLDAQAADISLMQTQGQGLAREIKEKLAAARREGAGAREALKQEGAAAEAALLAEVKRETDLEWSRVEQQIKDDLARARKALKAQIQSFAQLLASKILGRELS
jgi:F-type H+-transporting ATPase subunit b